MSLSKIKHVVVLMMENRSLDNMLGYLYADKDNKAPHVLPAGSSPLYDGLSYFPPKGPVQSLLEPDRSGVLFRRRLGAHLRVARGGKHGGARSRPGRRLRRHDLPAVRAADSRGDGAEPDEGLLHQLRQGVEDA